MKRPASDWGSFVVPSVAATKNYLTADTPYQVDLARELWNVSTGAPGLLDARIETHASSRGKSDWIYNPASGKYRKALTGKTVSDAQMRMYIMRLANESRNRIRQQTKALLEGSILFVVWYNRVRDILKSTMMATWMVWIGGTLFYDDAQRFLFYLFILAFFQNFDEFSDQFSKGETFLDGRSVARAAGYGRSAYTIFQNIKLQVGIALGHTQARRVLGENENHCIDSADHSGCIELAARGWVDIRKIVPLGAATCRGNCLCTIETRKHD